MICWVLAMEMLQGVWKQHLRPRAVVGYGLKIVLPSPPNYVTRSPGQCGGFHLSLNHTPTKEETAVHGCPWIWTGNTFCACVAVFAGKCCPFENNCTNLKLYFKFIVISVFSKARDSISPMCRHNLQTAGFAHRPRNWPVTTLYTYTIAYNWRINHFVCAYHGRS